MAVKKAETRIQLPKTPTGIYGLDDITFGGIPKGRPTLVAGGPGSGKTLFSVEFLVHGTLDFDEPGVLMSFEEKEKEIANNVMSLGYDLNDLVERKKLALDYVSIERSEVEETGEYDLEGLFIRLNQAIDSIGAKRVVLDTIESLFSGLSNYAILRAELRRLFRFLKDKGVTAIITGERGEGNSLTRQGLEEYVSDCVILLDNRMQNELATRRLRIIKYRGSSHGSNEYPFIIDERGISILPVTSMKLEHVAPTDRISTGLPDLDKMMGGQGFFSGSSILISGASGTGKSSIAAAMTAAACQRGERALYLASEESPDQVIRNMRSIGIDLEPWVKKGLLKFHATRPSFQGLEMHLVQMQRLAKEFEPSLVVVDAISDFTALGSPMEIKAMAVRLIDFFKFNQISAVFTSLTNNPEVEESGVGTSSIFDSWLHLENVKGNLERNRVLYILKSRGMAHSNQMREFILSDNGIKLSEVYSGPAGAVLGTAKLSQEAADKDQTTARKQEVELLENTLEARRRALQSKIAAMQAEFEAEAKAQELAIAQKKEREKALAEETKERARKREASSAE